MQTFYMFKSMSNGHGQSMQVTLKKECFCLFPLNYVKETFHLSKTKTLVHSFSLSPYSNLK